MPIWDRDWYKDWFFKGKHPPTCTCVDCTNKRLGKSDTKHSAARKNITPIKTSKPDSIETAEPVPVVQKDAYHKRANKINNYVLSLLLIFSLSIIGIGISIFVGSFIPFWILFGFSFIYSIEKWFIYFTRKHKVIGKLYRLLLNLLILSLLGLIIWTGIQLFSQQFVQSPLVGSLIFLAEFILFIWIWRVVAKNGWRWPSMKLTVFSLICLFLIFAFAGVQPISSYKDNFLAGWSNTFDIGNDDTPVPVVPISPIPDPEPPVVTPMPTIVQDDKIDYKTGEYEDFYLGIVYDSSGTAIGGNGCYDDEGEFIVLINNKNAKNPTYSDLLSFLKSDETEQFSYQFILPAGSFYYGSAESNVNLDRIRNIIDGKIQPESPKVCADFAERLHNNAEKAGIRCGYVLGTMHSFNVFETTDKGLIYVDDTGTSFDCEAFIDANGKVRLQPLFPEDKSKIASITYVGGDVYYEETVWDGEWK